LPNKSKNYLKSLGHKSKNDKIDARGLAQMGLEQTPSLWKPLSKNIYSLRMLTRQHQRLQELKNQSENQKHAILHSQISDKFIIKQLDKLIKLYDQQIDQIALEMQNLLSKDPILKNKIDQLCKIKGLGMLSVATLVSETNGFEGFENLRQLVSFAGYDVVENQSGLRSGKTARRPPGSLKKETAGLGEYYSCQPLMQLDSENQPVRLYLKGYLSKPA
jgi:transposase